MSVTSIWLLSGVLLALAELHFAGIGLFFAGLGALTVGAALFFEWVPLTGHVEQFVVFFAATILWAGILWKPLQYFRRAAPGYSNIVGDTAYVGSAGLKKGGVGEVTWSGTIMQAELAADAGITTLEAGSPVIITHVVGAKLIVKPKT